MEFSLKTRSIDGFSHFPNFVHAFSPRSFKNENGTDEELSLGRKSDSKSSLQHRQLLLKSLNVNHEKLYLVKQVHGDRIFVLDNPQTTVDQVERQEADALVTHLTEKPVGVLSADCVPVILYDPEKRVTAVIHAGRKGTQRRIVSKTISILSGTYGCHSRDVRMALGPAIGGCCYEVDDACITPFREQFQEWQTFVTANARNRFMLDLLKANEADALAAGISKQNVHRLGECTACNTDRWFSYRREGITGRILSLAMLRGGNDPV